MRVQTNIVNNGRHQQWIRPTFTPWVPKKWAHRPQWPPPQRWPLLWPLTSGPSLRCARRRPGSTRRPKLTMPPSKCPTPTAMVRLKFPPPSTLKKIFHPPARLRVADSDREQVPHGESLLDEQRTPSESPVAAPDSQLANAEWHQEPRFQQQHQPESYSFAKTARTGGHLVECQR